MRTENSNDVFHITYSKWKIWIYAILCWIIACIPLLPLVLFSWALWTGEDNFTSNIMFMFVVCGALFLLFAVIPFIFLTKLNKPMASLSRKGFSGLKNLKHRNFVWTQNTVIYFGNKGSVILANLEATQSRASKLWGGPKAAVLIHHGFAKQKRDDVLEAVNRMSPYPVKQTTIWAAAKH